MPRKPRQEKRRGVFERVKGSNIWWIRYTDEQGKRVTAKVGTYAAAVNVYEQRTAAIRLGVLLPNAPRRGVKFSELAAEAIKFSEKHHRAAKDFEQRVNLANEEFGDRVAASITTRELQDWIDEKAEERGWTGGTRNRFKSSLSTVFREGMRAGKITANPARLIRRSKESLGRVRFLSFEEEARLRKAIASALPGRIRDAGESAYAQLDVALHTGMRKSEQFTATWDQVDLERGFIYLSMTKNGTDRFVTLNSAAREVLRHLAERHKRLGLPSDSTLFHSKREGLIKNPRKWFATALEQAKIEGVTWHTLRHTFASRLVMSGVDLKTVQELMGHKTIAMTARYAHLAPTHKLQALETLVRPGSVSVQSGYKLATNAKLPRGSRKLNSIQTTDSK